ncbi:hypothetical protein DFH07DRAFT_783657, partial [Mycena maculata]
MSEPPLTVYEERAACGMYDEIVQKLVDMGQKALGNLECPEDFVRHHDPSSWSNNIEFRDKDGFEFRTLIVGEIAGSVHGTVLRASGNHYAGTEFKPIDDSKLGVKDILALCMPTCATTHMANYYENQTIPLRAAEFLMHPWLRSTDEHTEQDDLIMCHMLPKYSVPGAGVPSPTKKAKRKLDNVRSDVRTSANAVPITSPTTARPVADLTAVTSSTVPLPPDSAIKLGTFYDPCLLPDYGGRYFRHVKAKLVQLDVCDGTTGSTEDPLILPYKFYDRRLKPGTLIYQINAHSIKVLADSDAPIEECAIMMPRNWDGSPLAPLPPPAEFASFSLNSSPKKVSVVPDNSLPLGGTHPDGDEDNAMNGAGSSKPPQKKHRKSGNSVMVIVCMSESILPGGESTAKKRPVKRRRFSAEAFLDLYAVDADHSEDDDDEGLDDGFVDDHDDLEYDAADAMFRSVQFSSEAEELAALAKRYDDEQEHVNSSRQFEREAGLVVWMHTFPDSVVSTIMSFSLAANSFQDIQSVVTTPASRGSVYVKCVRRETVEYIARTVDFVRRGVGLTQIPKEDYRWILTCPNKPEVPVTTWVRYIGRGMYHGDLAWIFDYNKQLATYDIFLVPRERRK